MLTKLSNYRMRSVTRCHRPSWPCIFKEVAMNGRDRILSARLSEDIIVTSSPGERNITYLGPMPKQDPSFGSICVQSQTAGLDRVQSSTSKS